MIKLNAKFLLNISFLALISLISCVNSPQTNLSQNISSEISIKRINLSISGKAEFPEFKTLANLSEINSGATVSVIYPQNHVTKPNFTMATGLTDSNGNFIVNLTSTVQIKKDDVFILEAIKRNGSSGNKFMAVRTFIKYNGSGWESITTPGIKINTKTTALCIISDYNKDILKPEDTINKIHNDAFSEFNEVSIEDISDVSNLVTQVLATDDDPISHIYFENEIYKIGMDRIDDPILSETLTPDYSIDPVINALPQINAQGDNKEYLLKDPTKPASEDNVLFAFGAMDLTSPDFSTSSFKIKSEEQPVYKYTDDVSILDKEPVNLKNKFQPIQNQFNRGTCNFFAWAGLIDFLDKEAGYYKEGKGISPQFFSWLYKEAYGYECTKDSNGMCEFTLQDGSYITKASKLIDNISQGQGVLTGTGIEGYISNPYLYPDPAPNSSPPDSYNIKSERTKFLLGDTLFNSLKINPVSIRKVIPFNLINDHSNLTISTIKACIYKNHPVIVATPVYNYTTLFQEKINCDFGKISWCNLKQDHSIPMVQFKDQNGNPINGVKKDGNHAFLLVGYENNAQVPGGGYFWIRNSWGEEWTNSDQGYGKIPYEYIKKYAQEIMSATLVNYNNLRSFFDVSNNTQNLSISIQSRN